MEILEYLPLRLSLLQENADWGPGLDPNISRQRRQKKLKGRYAVLKRVGISGCLLS